MNLADYIACIISDRLGEARKRMNEVHEEMVEASNARFSLSALDLNNADYNILIKSAEEGVDDVTLNHQGSLGDAILAAEKQLQANGSKSGFEREYKVEIKVADMTIPLPTYYWHALTHYAKPQGAKPKSSKATPGNMMFRDDEWQR